MTRNLIALPPILLSHITACLAMSSVTPGTLHRRLWVVWFYGFRAHALFTSTIVICWLAVGFGYGYGREPSVSAVVLVTAINRLQLQRHFRLRTKPEKNGFGWSLASTL